MVVVLLVRQLRNDFTKKAKVSPNLTVTHIMVMNCLKFRGSALLVVRLQSVRIIDRQAETTEIVSV